MRHTSFLGLLFLASATGTLVSACGDETSSSTSSGATTASSATTTTTTSTSSAGGAGGEGGAGMGGAGGTETGGTGGEGGAAPECVGPETCPGAGADCQSATCEGGICGLVFAAAGEPAGSQMDGDCKLNTCDGAGQVVPQDDNNDNSDDGNGCTTDICVGGVLSHPFLDAGTLCNDGGGTVCDGAGACVECVVGDDCASGICQAQTCVPLSCIDGQKNNAETDVDCGGGVCATCDADMACVLGADCASSVCTGSICQAPTCLDGVQNGAETDIDCGGACGGCSNAACASGADCASGVCAAGACSQFPLNGCTLANAVTPNGNTVTFAFPAYSPPCIKVTAGTTLTINGGYAGHPLLGGIVAGAVATPGVSGPFVPKTDTGTTHTFTFDTAGMVYPFYCTAHFNSGMYGAVIVQ